MLNELLRAFSPARFRCLLLGHDDTLAREPKHLFLRCDRCGRQTRGLTIGPPPGTAERLAPRFRTRRSANTAHRRQTAAAA